MTVPGPAPAKRASVSGSDGDDTAAPGTIAPRGGILAEELRRSHLQRRIRLAQRDAGLEPAEDGERPVPPVPEEVLFRRNDVLHHHRHEEVVGVLDARAGKPRRPDADDRKRPAVQLDDAADDCGIGAKSAAPAVVAEHDDRVRPWRLAFPRPGRIVRVTAAAPGRRSSCRRRAARR